jgi:hypothetical protein
MAYVVAPLGAGLMPVAMTMGGMVVIMAVARMGVFIARHW